MSAIIEIESVKFPDQLMADGTVPELRVARDVEVHGVIMISDNLETERWLSSIDAPISVGKLEMHIDGHLPGPEQLQKILNAMAGLMQAISEVGYEMAQQAHEGEVNG